LRLTVSSLPTTDFVAIVTLCSCLARADAFCVSATACLRLSVADLELVSCEVKPDVVEPEITGIPPETVPVMLNWFECCC
jgi:hypothetical protein